PFDELDGVRRTYRQAAADVALCAAALAASGIKPGDRVAVLSTPRPEFLTLFFAVSRIGAVWIGLNPANTPAELGSVLADCKPSLLVGMVPHELSADVPEVLGYTALIARGDGAQAEPGGSPADPGLIVYTSGTTGRPKGVVLSHRAFAEGCRLQATRMFHTPCVSLANLPVSHVGGVMDLVSVPIAMGGSVAFMEQIDPAAVPGVIERAGVTLWGQIPILFQLVLSTPAWAAADVSSLRYVGWGGASMPRELIPALRATGARLDTVYGLTETCVSVAYSDPDADDETLATTIGRPDPRLELRIVGEDGVPVAQGSAGQIELRNPCLMTGYLDLPAETAEVFTADGFLRTGDLGVQRPDGTVTLVGRLREMYKSGAYSVFPREVELAIETHPQVAAAAVVSVPDPELHEAGVAFVVASAETAAGLDGYCRDRLAAHKLPRVFVPVPGLPLLANGKVDKGALRERALHSPGSGG
ncbi:class I adenylate-forming enzyme family protein, partial [Actinocorallia lasiicapitis]